MELEDEEKFHDTDGNILEIETRGERDVDKIFFRVRDVMKRFDMPKLTDTLTRTRIDFDGYEPGLHYKHFTRPVPDGVGKSKDTTKKPVKALFLTYTGLLRVLFVSRNKNAEKFSRWAITKLFTIQMGTKEDKDVLGAKILNVNLECFKSVFRNYPRSFSAIYLLKLGRVEDLVETFQISETIDKNSFVYKFGFSRDLKQRVTDHEGDYGKLKNVNIEVELFHYIDVSLLSDAEGELRSIFEGYEMRLNVPRINDSPGRNELVVLNKKQFERVKKDYANTGKTYAGASEEMQEQVRQLKQQIQDLMSEMEKKELQHTLALRDEQMRTMEERTAKETLQRQLETQNKFHALEKEKLQRQLETQSEINALKLQLLQK